MLGIVGLAKSRQAALASLGERIEMAERHPERVALVTGAGRGIGRAIALELAKRSYSLCLAARTRAELEETRRLSGLAPSRSLIVLIDLAEEGAPEVLFDAMFGYFARLDLLVNNAGWAPARTPLTRFKASDEARVLAVNLHTPIALSRMAAARMTSGGAIVNIASTAAHTAPAGEASYAAAKAGLVAFTRACFKEFRAAGVRTSVIVPGLVDTEFIPANKRLDRAAMLKPADVARVVMQVIDAPPHLCPLEITLEPQRDPLGR
jgi:3-oxoacyl-[acyl-carrier protein] reductase